MSTYTTIPIVKKTNYLLPIQIIKMYLYDYYLLVYYLFGLKKSFWGIFAQLPIRKKNKNDIIINFHSIKYTCVNFSRVQKIRHSMIDFCAVVPSKYNCHKIKYNTCVQYCSRNNDVCTGRSIIQVDISACRDSNRCMAK